MAYKLISAGGYPCLRGVPEEIMPIDQFGLKVGSKINFIGETRVKPSSASRQDRFQTFVEYLGVIKVQDVCFMIFSSPQDTNLYLLYEFSDEFQEMYVSDPKYQTIRIYKPIFERIE